MPAAVLNIALGLGLTWLLALSGRPLRGTTLVGPWLWGIISGVLMTLAPLASFPTLQTDVGLTTLLTYAAGVSTLCPLVALLGARRPQHSAWQFVVATLYAILLVPAVQGGRVGGEIIIDAPWSWFLLALIAVGCINALFTRYWPAAGALATGQLLLLAPYLFPITTPTWFPQQIRLLAALGLLISTVLLLWWRATAVLKSPAWRSVEPLDRLWLDFRDAFGALWALRVLQRVNAAASQYGWPIELTWDGFYDRVANRPATGIPAEVRAGVEHVMRTVLWRFMSEQWMTQSLSTRPEERS